MVAAVLPGQFGLFLAAHRADDRHAQVPGPLAGDKPHAPCRRVEQYRLPCLNGAGAAEQIPGRHPLEHHRPRRHIIDAVWNLDQAVLRHDPHLGVRAHRDTGIGNAVPGSDSRDALADLLDHSRTFHADYRGQVPNGIQPGAVVHIDIVQPHGCVAQEHFALPGPSHIDFLPLHDLGTAGFVNLNCLRHDTSRENRDRA